MTEPSGSAAQAARAAAVELIPEAVEPGVLYVVSTPIGHLGDLSLRALAVLTAVDRVLCEDTRHARTLLSHYGVRTPTVALHAHNEARSAESIVAQLAAGQSLALISDAGTPLVSDPGERVVRAAVARGHRVVPVPGASAALAALVGAGLPAHPSTILGFLPRKGGERTRAIDWAVRCPHAVVVYESPQRVAETLRDLAEVAGAEREVVVARELTKRFEEFRRGTLGDLAAYYSDSAPRGEIVLVLAPAPPADTPTPPELREIVATRREAGDSSRTITEMLMARYGLSRNDAYQVVHEA